MTEPLPAGASPAQIPPNPQLAQAGSIEAQPAESPPSPPSPPQGELTRLHPLTPLVRGAKVLGALTAFGAYRTYQTVEEYGLLGPLTAIVLLGAVAMLFSWVSWRFMGYRLTGRELHIQAGVLARRHRTVPLERVQAIDVVRPVLARLLGLAELRLEVVGGTDTEGRLAYLSTGEAAALRTRLLALVAQAGPDESPHDHPAAAAVTAEQPLFAVNRTELVISQVLTPFTFALPFLFAWPLVSLAWDGISVATIFGAVSGIVGVAQVPVRRVLREYNFAVAHTSQGLRIRSGLLETRTQTVAPGRVQAVRIRRPLLWRPLGWVRVEIDVAGYGGTPGSEEQQTSALVPVADERTADALIRQVMPAAALSALDEVRLTPAPRRARWLAPLRYRRLATGATTDLFVCRSGWLTPQHDVLVHARVQSLRYTQGPLQRRLGLASVHADLAGGHGSAVAEHQDAAAAVRLLDELIALARANRSPVRQS